VYGTGQEPGEPGQGPKGADWWDGSSLPIVGGKGPVAVAGRTQLAQPELDTSKARDPESRTCMVAWV